MGNQSSFELEQPGAKRYVCGSCGANASTKLYVCGHCKVTRYCSAAHQKKDKKFHVGKVCNDLRKSRKQYRKQKHNKRKKRSTANDNDINDPSSTDLQLWNEQQQQHREEQHEDDSDDNANIDPPPQSRCRHMLSCKWWTDLVWGYLQLLLFYIFRFCCLCCPRRVQRNTYICAKRHRMKFFGGFLFLFFFMLPLFISSKTAGGINRALRLAAKSGDVDRMQNILLYDSPDIDATDKFDMTALAIAAAEGHDQAVRLLLEHNPNLERKDMAGLTPLMLAASARQLKTVKILLKAGADISTKSVCNGCSGMTVLMMSLMRHPNVDPVVKPSNKKMTATDLKTFRYLLNHPDCNVNQLDNHDSTILHMAASIGQLDIVKDILKTDVNVLQEMDIGLTARGMAEYLQYDHLVRWLRSAEIQNGGGAVDPDVETLTEQSRVYYKDTNTLL